MLCNFLRISAIPSVKIVGKLLVAGREGKWIKIINSETVYIGGISNHLNEGNAVLCIEPIDAASFYFKLREHNCICTQSVPKWQKDIKEVIFHFPSRLTNPTIPCAWRKDEAKLHNSDGAAHGDCFPAQPFLCVVSDVLLQNSAPLLAHRNEMNIFALVKVLLSPSQKSNFPS